MTFPNYKKKLYCATCDYECYRCGGIIPAGSTYMYRIMCISGQKKPIITHFHLDCDYYDELSHFRARDDAAPF